MIYDLRSAFGGAYGQHTKCYAKFQKVDDRTTHAVLVVSHHHRYHPPEVRLFPMGSSSVLDLSATTSPGPVKLFDFASVAPSSDESCKD